MKSVSDVTFLVIDSGLFFPMALRLAEDAKRVIWHNPDQRGFPSLRQGAIGDGFEQIQTCLDFWPLLGDVDCVVIPDISHSGLQQHLRSIGKAVWGSGIGDRLELNREFFMRRLGQMGLSVPSFEVVVGLSKLREHLRECEDVYIKVSRWRGDFETTHWRNWALDSGWLDQQAVNFGPLQESIRFLVFDAIDTNLEIGADTYFVGNWPALMLAGTESKDKTFFGSVMPIQEMPEQIQELIVAVAPYLRDVGYTNFISFEDRVTEETHCWTDATQRPGKPSSGSQELLWDNYSEIIWAGANGELVDPVPVNKFSIECQITCKPEKDTWVTLGLPRGLERHCRLSYCGYLDGCYVFPPDEFHHGELGWLVATADTPKATLELAKALCDELPDGVDANVEGMVDLIKEVDEADKEGITLSSKPMPNPGEVISD
jgi:hypothetical protein